MNTNFSSHNANSGKFFGTKFFSAFSLLLMVLMSSFAFGQTNSYLGLNGGFEGTATIDNTTLSGAPVANTWGKANANVTIASETTTVRSGAKSLKVSSSTTSTGRVYSPLMTISASTTAWQVQYYRRATSTTATVQNQTGNLRNGTEQLNGLYTTVTAANTWEKVTYSPASTTSATTAAADILAKMATSAGDMYYDDFVLYESASIDNTAPLVPGAITFSGQTTSSIGVSWGAASGGVDGGGYIVVRGTVDPTTAPNVNGIYAAGNTIAAGMTVVYQGTGTSFTDSSLSAGTTYYYRVYTYDKAYNYSTTASTGNSATSSAGFTVTYNGNTNTTGTAPVDGSSPYASGATVTVLGPGTLGKSGYTFSGWNTAANGSGTSYAAGATFTMPSSPVVLYAQWTASGFVSTATGGDWNTAATWIQNAVPTSTDEVTIVSGATVSVATGVTRNALTTVNGTFQINAGGFAGGTTDFVYGASGTLIFNHSNSSVYGPIDANHRYWPATNSPFNVKVQANSPINLGVARTVAGTFENSSAMTGASNLTVNGIHLISGTGATYDTAINYGAASTLTYNVNATMARGNEWNNNPANVILQNNSVLNYPSNWGFFTRNITGNLTIGSGSALYMDYGSPATGVGTLTVGGNLVNSGGLSLGNQSGGDLILGGNWTNSGTFSPNGRAVSFNGSGTQIVTNAAGETFAYLIHNGSGSLQFANNVTVNGNGGDVLQLQSGTINLNGKSLTLSGTSGNIKLGVAQTLTSATATTLNISGGTKTVTGGVVLTLPSTVTTVLTSGIDFGNNLTSIAGKLQINPGGFVTNNPPVYANTSTLEYKDVINYGISTGWTGNATTAGSGTPYNVTLTNSSATMPVGARALAGTLTIGVGSTLTLDGTFASDLSVGGNWSNSGTFNPNNRAVIFNGGSAQTLTGATTFDYLTLNNSTGLTLNNAITVTNILDLTSGKLTLGTNNLTLNSAATITNASATNYIVTNGTGRLVKAAVGNAAFIFPIGLNTTNYTPVAITNTAGTSDLSVNVGSTITNAVSDATRIVNLQWSVTSSAATTATVVPTWVAANQAASFTNTGTGELGNYTTAYTTYPVTLNTTTTTASGVAIQAGSNAIVVGNTGAVYTAAPANDLCANAIALTINNSAVSGTLAGATVSSPMTDGKKDVWYKFTPSCTASHTITVNGFSGDVDLYLFNQSSTCPTTTTSIFSSTTTNPTETITATLTGGVTYYVRVIAYDVPAEGAFNISVSGAVLGASSTISASPASFCAGSTVTFTAAAVANATSYVWTVPAGWTMTPSSTNTMSATVGSNSGAVIVQAANCYGTGAIRSTNFTPNTIPATPGTITGNTTTCQGTSNTYTIAAVTGATSYTWTLPSGWSGTSTTASITTTSGATGGTLSVTANNTCGSSAAQTLDVTVNAPPATPTTPTSDNAACGNVTLTRATPPAGETWFWQGTVANGIAETDSNVTYTVTTSGTYYLRSKNTTTGCWSASASIVVTVNPVTAITTQPANQSAATGTTATFTVVAAGSGLTYQWQESTNGGTSWNNVSGGSGANTASYTTVNTTLAMNGYKYRVVINGTCGNVTSDGNATLTVADIIYANGDYRSVTDGNWHSTAASGSANTWQQLQSGVWTNISNSPPSNAASLGTNKVYINNNITLVGTNTAPQIVIIAPGELHTSTATATFGNILVKAGSKFYREGNASGMNAAGTFEIEDGGYAYITQTNTSVPTIWAGTEKFRPNSNVVIKRLDANNIINSSTTISPYTDASGNSAYFGNLIIDSSVDLAILNGINATSTRITNGDLILRTGSNTTSSLIIAENAGTSSSANPYTIGGNFIIENTFTGTASLRSSATTTYVKVIKDFITNGNTTFRMGTPAVGVYMFVDGNINIKDTSKFYFMNSSVASLYTLSLKGDITVESGATFTNANTNNAIGNTIMYFTGDGDGSTGALTQTIDIAPATGSNAKIDFRIVNPTIPTIPYVKLINQNLALGTNSTFTVNTNGTLDFGFDGTGTTALNMVRVSGQTGQAFSSASGSILKITSPLGITLGSTPDYTGNVQIGSTAANRVFDIGGIFHYTGKANQVAGNGLPAAITGKVIVEMDDDALVFNASGNKTFASGGTLEIRKGIVEDTSSNSFGDATSSTGNLTMTGGRYRIFKASTQPDLSGTYNLTAGVVDFANTNASTQTVRNKSYLNIEVTGKPVGNSVGNITILPNGTFTVKGGGEFTINSNAIVGPVGSQVLTVENGGTFKTGDSNGFSGSTSSSVRNDIETINLNAGSTVEYSKAGDQTITNAGVSLPTDAHYQNLRISGSGVKTASGTTTVNEKIYVDSGTLSIPATADNTTANILTAKKGVAVGGGIFNLENNAQLMQDVDAVNTGKITAKRNAIIPVSTFNQYVYWSSPVDNQNFRDIFPTNPNTLALYYNEANDKFYTSSGAYIPGRGLAVRNPITATGSAANLGAEFKGVPYVGNLDFPLAFTDSSHGNNLMGNPYPSNLDLDLLYTHSTGISSTLQFWDNTSNTEQSQLGSGYHGYSYAKYNAVAKSGVPSPGSADEAAGSKSPNRILKIGQGFMVKATALGAQLGFRNADRITGQSLAQFFGRGISDSTADRYYLEMVTPSKLRFSNAIVYFDGGKDEFSADDSRLEGQTSEALFTSAGVEKVVINGRSAFKNTDVIQVGNRFYTDGTYQIRAGSREGIFASGQAIYLKDKQTGTITNLSEGEYSFAANAGESTGRFELIYLPQTPLATDEVVKSQVSVYRDGSDFVVKATQPVTNLQVFDISGRMLLDLKPNALETRIDGNKLPDGVYILKIGGKTLKATKKIIK